MRRPVITFRDFSAPQQAVYLTRRHAPVISQSHPFLVH